MPFILESNRIDKFDNLRKDYETKKNIDLQDTPSIIGMPTFLGGTDVKNRRKQISFLEKIKAVLNRFLLKEEDIKTPQQWQANLMASRIMIAACLYVQSEISSGATLNHLINEYLGVTAENFFDKKDKVICYQTAHKLIDQLDVLTSINTEMRSLGKKEFSETEWGRFSSFILKEEALKKEDKKKKSKTDSTNYPVTNFVLPVFENAFSYVGLTVGWVVAEVISSSSAAIAPRIQLTSWVGGALMILGPTGATGVALLAPTIAARLLSSFCTISLASITGKAMGLVGKGTGIVVGLPFDLIYNLLWATGTLLINYSTNPSKLPSINGVRIADGVIVRNGQPIQFQLLPQEQLTGDVQLLQITEHGEIYLNGEPVDEPDNKMAKVIKELNEKFSLSPNAPKPEITDISETVDAEETAHTTSLYPSL